MNKNLLILSILMLLFSCQNSIESNIDDSKDLIEITVNPEPFCQLPSEVDESSGLILFDGLLWTFNDSGGLNILYGINYSGEIVREIEIENAMNVDWEEIAQDDDFIYVGDFGNNDGFRKDLKIYMVNKSELNDNPLQTVTAKVIRFSYQDQENFNYMPRTTPYDCEAMVAFKDSLYLFTKNWSEETTTVYKVPKEEGEYILNPWQEFDVNCLVTGADISPDESQLAFIGYKDFRPVSWIFSDISTSGFFNGNKTFIRLDDMLGAQTEGICYVGNDSLFISCEYTFEFNQQVFLIDLEKEIK